MRHHRHGAPEGALHAAMLALDERPLVLEIAAPAIATAPLGPSRRRYANTAAIVRTALEPEAMLAHLQTIERAFGRRRRGARWGARVLDLDIVLWSGGAYVGTGLIVPHPAFRKRAFVLDPATRIAADWRDPVTGLAIRHLRTRLTRPRAVRR